MGIQFESVDFAISAIFVLFIFGIWCNFLKCNFYFFALFSVFDVIFGAKILVIWRDFLDVSDELLFLSIPVKFNR